MEKSQKISTENCYFYSREISLYIALECLRNCDDQDQHGQRNSIEVFAYEPYSWVPILSECSEYEPW